MRGIPEKLTSEHARGRLKGWVVTKLQKHAWRLRRAAQEEHGSDPKPGLVFQNKILSTTDIFWLKQTVDLFPSNL